MQLKNKIAITAIVAIVVIAIVIVVVTVLMGISSIIFLHGGDYAAYDVTGVDQNGNPLAGQMIFSVSNVTASSYDIKAEYPGLNIPTRTAHFNGAPALTTLFDLGTKTQSSVKLSTVFGNKTVDVYTKNTNGQVVTSYAGSNPLVQYKMVITSGLASITFILDNTNIEKVKTGNSD